MPLWRGRATAAPRSFTNLGWGVAANQSDFCEALSPGAGHLEKMAVTLSPFASLRVNSATSLAHRTQRSFAALRMTAKAPLK